MFTRFCFVSSLLFIFLAVTAQKQQDTSTTYSLPEATTTSFMADKQTPITFQNLDMDQFEPKNTGQEPSFILSETPSMTVYSDAGSQQGYSYFRMRGIDQTRINMTLS